MTEPLFKKKLKADELEALITKRLGEHEECAGISVRPGFFGRLSAW
jgi:hypothetical protein